MELLQKYMKLLQMFKSMGIDLTGQSGQSDGEFVSPLDNQYRISQGFGNYNPALYAGKTAGARHMGMDVATPAGTLVKAPVSGNVTTGYDPNGFGQYVDITSDDGTTYRFSHLSAFERALQKGGKVKAGQAIAKTGGVGPRAGNSTGAHLDMSVKRNGQYIDPQSVYQRG